MKITLCAAAFLCLVTHAHAAITCWYGPGRNFTGADDADSRYPQNQVSPAGGPGVSSDYTWAYTVDGNPSECPKMLPKNFDSAKSDTTTGIYLYTGPLTTVGSALHLTSPHLGGGYVVVVPCKGASYDTTALARLPGQALTVTGRYNLTPKGGKFCATGFIAPQS